MRVVVFCLLLTASVVAHADDELECSGGTVSAGATSEELAAACGDPTLRESLGRAIPGIPYDEELLFNFGPRKRLRIVRLREQRIASFEDDGYGFRELPKLSCDFYSLKEGMSKFRLLYSCGRPASRETVAAYRNDERGKALPTVLRERWHYNSPKGERFRTVTLENGRVVNVEDRTPLRRN